MTGYVYKANENGVMICVELPNAQSLLERKQITEVEVIITDGRTITPAQRRKIFALVNDITEYVSAPPHNKKIRAEEEMLRELKLLYIIHKSSENVRYNLTQKYCELRDIDLFSLSDVNETLASDFIDWLVEQCVKYAIPCMDTLINRAEDIERYIYICILHRRCAVCGARADIHEVETVGAGRNRRKMHHLGQLCQPLCRKHHSELHSTGQKTFDSKYLLCGVRLDEHLCKAVKYKK